jgi:hypothetical protein
LASIDVPACTVELSIVNWFSKSPPPLIDSVANTVES